MTEAEKDFYDDDEMSELSSSPSIPEGDIDFSFVYALHTFLATVEGQASSQKGDTLVLLDDSNSYWWLIRNVKDQSIGYLPAEHIETPFERLARLNKHRNVDMGASHVNDAHPVPRPSKFKMMTSRKAGARSVTFSPPKFIEYDAYESEDEYEEEMEESEATQATDDLVDNSQHTTVSSSEVETVQSEEVGPAQASPLVEAEPKEEPDTGRRYSLTPINTNGTQTTATTTSPESIRSTQSKAHVHKNSLSSVQSDVSGASLTDDSGETKEKKKKGGVFGSLFKKRSKREKPSVASNSITDENEIEKTESGRSLASKENVTQESRSEPEPIRIHDPERPSQIVEIPSAVNEMRSSVLMQVDPVAADMIDRPGHRGPVDEVEMMQTQRSITPEVNERRRSPEPEVFVWSDANISVFLNQDREALKNRMLLVTHQAAIESSRAGTKAVNGAIQITEFNTMEKDLDVMLKNLDALLVR